MEALRGVLGFKGERGYSAYEVAVRNGFKGTEQDWLANLGLSSHFERCSNIYTITEVNTTQINIPDCYNNNAFIDVYVEGERLNSDEYTVDEEINKIVLVNAIDTVPTRVEVITLIMSTNSLPIVTTINSNSTNNVYYDTNNNEQTVDGFPEIDVIALTDSVIRVWMKNANSTDERNGYFKITLMKIQ